MTACSAAVCRDWIASYIRPWCYVNHMHGEVGLRLMMQEDTNTKLTKDEFRDLMLEAGYEPANYSASEWEFRISSAPLRMRPKSRVAGWMPTSCQDRLTRRA